MPHDPVSPVSIKGKKLLVTGPTGQVAMPLLRKWADEAEIWAISRFADEAQPRQVEQIGARALRVDLADPEALAQLPDDFDYLLNFAVLKSGDFERDIAVNAESAGRLIAHCRNAAAALHCSTTAVYQYAGHEPRAEDAPLGDNHRSMFPTYSLAKIAAEAVVRFAARAYGVPTVIARLSVPYGDNGGWPFYHLLMMEKGVPIDIHPQRPNVYSPIHADDYAEKIPRLLAAASREPLTVNFGGSQPVSIEDWCAHLTELTGLTPSFRETEGAFGSLEIDVAKMHRLIGETRVDWRDGLRRMVEALRPDLLRPQS